MSVVCFAVLPGQSRVGRKKLLRWKALHSQSPPSQWNWFIPFPHTPHSLCTVIVALSFPLVESAPVQHNMFWSAALYWRVTIQKCHLLTHQICHFNVFRSRSVHLMTKVSFYYILPVLTPWSQYSWSIRVDFISSQLCKNNLSTLSHGPNCQF